MTKNTKIFTSYYNNSKHNCIYFVAFSTIPLPANKEAVITTINTINATVILYAVKDKPFHVSVRPTNASLKKWYEAGANSIWTMTLKSVVVKWDGVR